VEENKHLFNKFADEHWVAQHRYKPSGLTCGFWPVITLHAAMAIDAVGGYGALERLDNEAALDLVCQCGQVEQQFFALEPHAWERAYLVTKEHLQGLAAQGDKAKRKYRLGERKIWKTREPKSPDNLFYDVGLGAPRAAQGTAWEDSDGSEDSVVTIVLKFGQ
jgi:hypothetical protein